MDLSEDLQPALNGRLFYGWVIVLCGAVVLGVTHGVVTNCYSLYIIPVSESLGVSRDAFSVCSLIVNALYALISYISGAVARKIPLKWTLRIAGLLLPASYFCYSFCASIEAFWAVSFLVGVSVSFLTFVPFTSVISNWFVEKRGTALGICFMGSGLGGMVMNSLIARLLERYGWQTAYRVTGAIMLAVLVISLFFVIKVTPQEMGLRPLGAGTKADSEPLYGLTFRQALRTSSFFALILLTVAIGFISSMLSGVIAPHLVDSGYDTLFAARIVTFYLGALAVSKILLGRLYDRIGAIPSTLISMMGFLIGLAGLYFCRSAPALPLIMVASLGTAASNVSYPITTQYAFGTRDYATIYGFMMGTNFVFSSLGVYAANRLFTMTGSYQAALLLSAGIAVLAILILPLIRPANRGIG